ncbi:hypothetical protein [Flavobacterium sp. K5-23]|uniref:hypothetical protein n=1 Tax=Flavobacterium sp. K5-23 TaxID=2746225 RepID=UPI00201018A6|nr:hypothetical protein [Flavobacterium sp. K5-23]UQD57301.1 hypothetical protein FLAK523_13225 [Flavobacterium sp. K5-23]
MKPTLLKTMKHKRILMKPYSIHLKINPGIKVVLLGNGLLMIIIKKKKALTTRHKINPH